MKRRKNLSPEEAAKTKKEINQYWISLNKQGKKPSLRSIAKRWKITRPTLVKLLGGWKGIQRGKPNPPKKKFFQSPIEQGKPTIEPHSFKDEKGGDK